MGAAAFGKREAPSSTAAAILGSLLPDSTIFFMVAWQGWIVGRTGAQIFGVDYYSPLWQEAFAVSNSLPVYLLIAVAGYRLKRHWLLAFGAAAMLHILADVPLHVDDGHPPFWPFSDWIFESQYSYWDVRHGARYIAPAEFLLSLLLAAWAWRRFSHWLMRATIALLLASEAYFSLGGFWIYGN